MVTPLDAIRDALLELDVEDAPLITATLDLRPDSQGQIRTNTVLKQAMQHEGNINDLKRDQDLRSIRADEEAAMAAIDEAVEEGAQGLLYVGAANDDVRHVLTTPLPFRNVVRLGERPYLFEMERYRNLYARPLVFARVHHDSVEIHRVVLGRPVAEEEMDVPRYAVSRSGGRTQRSDSVSATQGRAGGHSKNRVEESIEAHQEQFARDAADRIAKLMEPGDLLMVAGPEEARSNLINDLRDDLRELAVEENDIRGELTERDLADFAGRLSRERQFMDADALAEEIIGGAAPERTAIGVTEVGRGLSEGRIDTLLFHDDVVGHFGDAFDARHQPGRLAGDLVEGLLRDALGVSAELAFSRYEPLLERGDGVAARLRW